MYAHLLSVPAGIGGVTFPTSPNNCKNAAGGGCPFRPQIPSNIYFYPIMTKLACQFFLYAIALDFPSAIRYDGICIIPSRRNLLYGDKEAGALYSRRKL